MRLPTVLLLAASALFTVIWLRCTLILHQRASGEEAKGGKWSTFSQPDALPMWRSLLSDDIAPSLEGWASFAQNQQPWKPTDCNENADSDEKFLHVQYFPGDSRLVADTLKSASDLAVATGRKLIQPGVQHAHFVARNAQHGDSKLWALRRLFNIGRLILSGGLLSRSRTDHDPAYGTCAGGWDVLVAFLANPKSEHGIHPYGEQAMHVDKLVAKAAAAENTSLATWDCTEHFSTFLAKESSIKMRCQNKKQVNCVDGSRVESLQALKEDVFLNASCVNILSWYSQHHLTQLPFIQPRAFLPSSALFRHESKALPASTAIRKDVSLFKASHLGMLYIGVYFAGVDLALSDKKASQRMRRLCSTVVAQVRKVLATAKSVELFLATDSPHWDAVETLGSEQFRALQVAQWHARRLTSALRPITLDAVQDVSVRHVMEQEILVSADYLILVGAKSTTDWLWTEFDQRHPKHMFRSKLYWQFSL